MGQIQSPITYDDALRACSREARATLAAALLIFIFFWGAIWLLKDASAVFWGFPVWFIAAVAGGYLFSVAAVVWIVKQCFSRIPLDLRPEDFSAAASDPASAGRAAR